MISLNSLSFADVWSAGCVLAELHLGQPIFPGDSGVDQLVEIIKVLGTPTREQIREMNPNYQEFKFPQIKAHPWSKVGWRLQIRSSSISFRILVLSSDAMLIVASVQHLGITTTRLRTFRLRHFVYRHFVYRYFVYYDFPC